MQFPNEALQNFQDRSNDLRNAERNLCNWLAKYFQETEPDIEEGTFLVLSEFGEFMVGGTYFKPVDEEAQVELLDSVPVDKETIVVKYKEN